MIYYNIIIIIRIGDNMVTIKEIAKECNVSIATVSNILNGKPNASEETRKKVLETVKQLNYTPNYVAKNLKMKKSKAIGVIVEDITVFCTPEIIDGITKCCEEFGYHILLTNMRMYKKFSDTYYVNEDFEQIVDKEINELLSKQVDGIIYVTAHERKLKCFSDNLKIPAIIAYGYSKNEFIPSVVVDDKSGAYLVIKHLIDNGHKNIGVITGKENSIHTNDRLEGYQKALYDNNICFNPEFVIKGDWSRQSGYDNTDYLINKGVSAIFCMNDIMAGGVYDRLEQLNKNIGNDISVVGFHNRELSVYYHPSLTTVALPLFEIGYTACKNIIKTLDNPHNIQKNQIIEEKCYLIKRFSVHQNKS